MVSSGVGSQWLAFLLVCFCLDHCISAGNVKHLQKPGRPASKEVAEYRHPNEVQKTLRPSMNDTLPHIVDYACAAADTSSPANFDLEKCNSEKMKSLIYCPLWSLVGYTVDMSWTALREKPSQIYDPKYQAISMAYTFWTLGMILLKYAFDIINPQQQKLCWRTGPDGLPISFGIARDLVQGCQLAHPVLGCPFIRNGRIDYNADGYILPMLAKLGLHNALLVEDGLAPSSSLHKDLCWEPELRDAYSLYQQPGPWQVNEECVEMLQDLAKKMIMHVMKDFLAMPYMHWEMDLPEYMEWHLVAVQLLTDVFSGSSDVFLQRFIFPSFQRFKDTARQRRGSVATGHEVQSSVVSCRGLQGTREQVEDNLVQLLRLVLVNDIHLLRHNPAAYLCASVANHLLHCTLLLFI